MNTTQTTTNPLGYEKIGKLLTSYAIPSIIALIINSLYNMVDQIFIGQGVGFGEWSHEHYRPNRNDYDCHCYAFW